MRSLFMSAPWLAGLGAALLIGCADSNPPHAKAPAGQAVAKSDSEKPSTATSSATEAQYVLTVEGMT
jgi:hypothetical protein